MQPPEGSDDCGADLFEENPRGIRHWVGDSDSVTAIVGVGGQRCWMNSQLFRRVFLLSLFFVCSAVEADYSHGQTNPLTQEQLIAGAKREGKLVWYATLTSADARTFLSLFEQKYPFIKTTHYGANSERMLNRIFTEASAGQHLFDLVNVAPINILKTRGFLISYRSVEAHAYPAEFRDPQDFWVSFYDLRYVLAYNTALIKPTEAPNDWTDLVDPKWSGKLGMDKEEYEWYAGLLKYWGENKTRKFMQALSHQRINWHKGHTLIAQLMAAGEFPLALAYQHRIDSMKVLGAPVEWVKNTNPILVALGPLAVSAKAAHPNAAKLFVDFALSREGQLLLRRSHRFSGRNDLISNVTSAQNYKPKLAIIDPEIAPELSRYGKEFNEIFFH